MKGARYPVVNKEPIEPSGLAAVQQPALGRLWVGRLRRLRPGWPRRPDSWSLWLLWPLALAIALLMVLPVVYLLIRTLGAGTSALTLLWRPRLAEVLLNSIGLVVVVTTASTLLAIPLAWLTVRTDLPLRRLWSVMTTLPLVIPSYISGYALIAAVGPKGLLQELLEPLGVTRLPDIYGFGGAALALTLCTYPYQLLSLRAALRGIDPSWEEAARGLGQGAWSTFWRITIPQLRPALGAGALLVALYTLGDFGAVALLQFDTFTRSIYVQYQASFDRLLAAALALVLVALTGLLLLLESSFRGRASYARGGRGSSRPARRIALGGWRWPAIGFCGLITAAALLLPLGIVLSWFGRGLLTGGSVVTIGPLINSLQAAALAAIGAVLASLPLAILVVRYPGWATRCIERIAYIGYALPGIVIGLALVFFGANYAGFLYQTLAMLIVAYIVRFLPQAVGTTRTALLQVNPRVEEAARGLGQSPRQVSFSITLPLTRPGLLAGAAMTFLTVMKELPVTLLLSPIGFETLAISLWQHTATANFAAAAGPALVLLLASAGPVWLMLRREEREH